MPSIVRLEKLETTAEAFVGASLLLSMFRLSVSLGEFDPGFLCQRRRGVSPEAVRRAVELSVDKYCSVAATLRPTAEIVSSYEVLEETAVVS